VDWSFTALHVSPSTSGCRVLITCLPPSISGLERPCQCHAMPPQPSAIAPPPGNRIDSLTTELKAEKYLKQPRQHECGELANYPEGGWRAWGVVVGSWCALFGSVSFMNSIGTFQAYLLRHQLRDYTPFTVGWIFGVYNGLTFLLGFQSGPIFDARGPRELIAGGGVLTVLYLMLLGVCDRYWHFMLVFGIVGGLSLSLVFTPAIAIVAHYFDKRRGLATGIASSGGGCRRHSLPTDAGEPFRHSWLRVGDSCCRIRLRRGICIGPCPHSPAFHSEARHVVHDPTRPDGVSTRRVGAYESRCVLPRVGTVYPFLLSGLVHLGPWKLAAVFVHAFIPVERRRAVWTLDFWILC